MLFFVLMSKFVTEDMAANRRCGVRVFGMALGLWLQAGILQTACGRLMRMKKHRNDASGALFETYWQ